MIKIYVYLILYSFHVLQTTTINKNYLKTFDQTGIMPTRISYPEQLIKIAWVKMRHCGKLKVELIPHNFDLVFLFIFSCSHCEWRQAARTETWRTEGFAVTQNTLRSIPCTFLCTMSVSYNNRQNLSEKKVYFSVLLPRDFWISGWTCLFFKSNVNIWWYTGLKWIYNQFHNIWRLFDVLPNLPFTTSETTYNYHL